MKTYKQVRESNGQFSYLTRWQIFKRGVRKAFKIIALMYTIAFVMLGIYTAGSKSTITYAAGETVIQMENNFPILDKIATCESKGKQFLANGVLVKHVNTNGTIDIGKYEINTVWEAKSVALGYNIYTEEGNHDMALWLFKNQGSEPWASSRFCWSK
jgi:hypothetical protein